MQLDWEKMFKRYVFDDVRTPYFTPALRLTQTQARYELFVYTIFLGMLFAVLSVASLSPDLPHKGAAGVSAYALSVVLAAVAFGVTRHPWAAAYCASAPLAALFYFLIYGFHPNLGGGDKVLLVAAVLVWLRYSWRVLAIVRTYPSMPPS
jgi:hypothetical protein